MQATETHLGLHLYCKTKINDFCVSRTAENEKTLKLQNTSIVFLFLLFSSAVGMSQISVARQKAQLLNAALVTDRSVYSSTSSHKGTAGLITERSVYSLTT